MYSLLEIERKYGYNKRKNILEKRGRYLKKKECAYCKKEFDSNRKRSAEHIFPQVLLELFPEQDVSFTPERTFKDNFGLTIADVCSECNNGILSGLDQYGGKLIKEQFLEEIDYNLKDSEIEKEIDKEKAPLVAAPPSRHKYGEYKTSYFWNLFKAQNIA